MKTSYNNPNIAKNYGELIKENEELIDENEVLKAGINIIGSFLIIFVCGFIMVSIMFVACR